MILRCGSVADRVKQFPGCRRAVGNRNAQLQAANFQFRLFDHGVNTAHDPDPACCPMEVGAGNICEVDKAAVVRNCKNGMAKFMPEGSTNSNLQESDWLSVPACAAHRAKLGCTLPAK